MVSRLFICLFILLTLAMGQPASKIVYSGLDNLIRQNFEPVRGKKAALFCNHSSQTLGGEHILDVAAGSALEIGQLFILRDSEYDKLWPQPDLLERHKHHAIAIEKPYLRPHQFRGVDYLLFDMQITGTADDPVLALLRILMIISQRLELPLVILDRPNYFAFMERGGPVHTGLKMPFFHGFSLGEAARYFNKKDGLLKDELLQVIPMLNYHSDLPPEAYPHLLQAASPLMKEAGRVTDFPAVRLARLSNLETEFHESLQQLLLFADWLDSRRLHADLLRETGSDHGLKLILLENGPLTEFSAFAIQSDMTLEAIFTLFRAAAVIFPNEFFLSPRRCTESFGDDMLNRLIIIEKRPVQHIIHYWEPELRAFQKFSSEAVYLYRKVKYSEK